METLSHSRRKHVACLAETLRFNFCQPSFMSTSWKKINFVILVIASDWTADMRLLPICEAYISKSSLWPSHCCMWAADPHDGQNPAVCSLHRRCNSLGGKCLFVCVPFDMKRLAFLRFARVALTVVGAKSQVAHTASDWAVCLGAKNTLAGNLNGIWPQVAQAVSDKLTNFKM